MPCRRKWAGASGGVAAAGLRCGGDRDAVGDGRVAGDRRGHPGARGGHLRVRPLGELLGARRGPSCSYRRTVRPHRRAFADGGGAVYMVISVRNVGTGLAVMHGWYVEVTGQPQQTHPPLENFTTQTRDIYVAPGDVGFWQGALRDPATAQFKAVAAAVEAGDPMLLTILYGDWEGGQRVISQFALRRANDRWLTTTGRHFNVDRPDPR